MFKTLAIVIVVVVLSAYSAEKLKDGVCYREHCIKLVNGSVKMLRYNTHRSKQQAFANTILCLVEFFMCLTFKVDLNVYS